MPSSAHLHKESAAWRRTWSEPSTLLRIRSMLTDGKRKAKGLLTNIYVKRIQVF
jgi:hypothetical protein